MSNLFSLLTIKNLKLKNRMVMPPMALDIASEQGEVTAKLIEHYLLRAQADSEAGSIESESRPGIGLIIVEHAYVRPLAKSHPRQLGIYDDSLIPGLKALVEALHKAGVPVGIQISHGGARALASPTAPSSIHSPYLRRFGRETTYDSDLPAEIKLDDINEIIKDFAAASRRAKEAGFDLLEIHGAHGYLLNEFYSPFTNHRQDQYGGTLENRLRLPLDVISAVKRAVNSELPIFYRLGADDRMPGGTCLEDSIKAVPYLWEAGVDCLDLSGGICGYLKDGPEGFFAYMAEKIRPVSKVPVLVTGGINNVFTANKLITEQHADLVGVGRALLKDPHWAKKAWLQYHSLDWKVLTNVKATLTGKRY